MKSDQKKGSGVMKNTMWIALVLSSMVGCVTEVPDVDEETSALEPAPSGDGKLGPITNAVCFPSTIFDQRILTCQSGWPGTRGCALSIDSPTDIVSGSVTTAIAGHNGEVSHSASENGPRRIDFTATIREGDAFSPGKNTTTYVLAWCRQLTP